MPGTPHASDPAHPSPLRAGRPAPATPATGGVRLLPVPRSQPPYDDEVAATDDPVTQGALALAYVLPGGLPAVPEPPTQLRLLADPDVAAPDPDSAGASTEADDEELDSLTARRRTPARELPEPRRWTARLAQALAEALGGHRPAQQLLPWVDDEVYATVSMRATTAHGRTQARLAPRPVVRTLRVTSPQDGVVEAGAVVQAGPRCRALALRLEGLDGRWRCTALEVL
ncbi:MAG TPA: Rv3235 family protein [Jiangellales bacterium]|nr:Rv3235 family protein [Jiangellales bacterium]